MCQKECECVSVYASASVSTSVHLSMSISVSVCICVMVLVQVCVMVYVYIYIYIYVYICIYAYIYTYIYIYIIQVSHAKWRTFLKCSQQVPFARRSDARLPYPTPTGGNRVCITRQGDPSLRLPRIAAGKTIFLHLRPLHRGPLTRR